MSMIWQKVMDGIAAALPFEIAAKATTQSTSSSATHTINLPTGISAGDILWIVIAWQTETQTFTSLSETWDLLNDTETGRGNFRVMWRVATGSEGATTTLTLSGASANVAAICFRITSAQDVEAGTPGTATTNSTTIDPPSLSPSWGSEETLWIAVAWTPDTRQTLSSYPTSYSIEQTTQAGTSSGTSEGQLLAVAARLLTASSEDPGVFTFGANVQHQGRNTYAVRQA